jgi:hypothetical protein
MVSFYSNNITIEHKNFQVKFLEWYLISSKIGESLPFLLIDRGWHTGPVPQVSNFGAFATIYESNRACLHNYLVSKP